MQPKNNDSKPGGERLWKSRFVEKSNKRTFPLRLENPHTPRIPTLRTASTTTGK